MRDTPPVPPAAAGGFEAKAPLLRRYAALCYEGLLLAAMVFFVGFLTLPLAASGAGPSLGVPPIAARVLSACMVFGLVGLYYTWSWTGGRRTLPMKTWRLILIRADGGSVDGKTAVTRYLAAWIGPLASLVAFEALAPSNLAVHSVWLVAIGYLWPLVDPDRQFLHDRIAGTRIAIGREPQGAIRLRGASSG